jgi:predicted lipoprotein with Yx(FWY)xxD motif
VSLPGAGITRRPVAFTRSKVRVAASLGVLAAVLGSVSGCELIALSRVPIYREGGALVDASGMTLYTFDRDARGASACDAKCAARWPPLEAAAGTRPAGDYSIVVRADGRRQWAYKGKPLYVSAADRKPGDRTGEAFDNVWRVARP